MNRKNSNKLLFILLIASLLLSMFPVEGVLIGTGVEFVIDNETYRVNQTMDFSRIMIIDNISIVFNNTGFNVTAPNNILFEIDYINSDIVNAVDGERVVGFYANTVGGDVWMNISGLNINNGYNVYRDSVLFDSYTSNSTGSISINSDSWSEHLFEIFATGNVSPVQSSPSPSDGASGVSLNPTLGITVNDADGNTMNQTFRTNASGTWVSIGWNNNTGNASLSNSTSVFDSYNTEYWWSSNTSDGVDGWDNDTYSFTTKSNTAPTQSNPSPGDGETGVSVSLASVTIDLADSESTFNWNITTNPDVGNNDGTGESNGSKTCNIAGLSYDGHYQWTVTAYDGNLWTNDTYVFTVESDPGTGPPPNSAPVISEAYPADSSTNIPLQPNCHVLVTDANIDTSDINFYNSSDGVTYYWSQKNSTVPTGTTVYWNFSQASSYDTTYYWKVTADDGTINVTYSFSFTTYQNEPVITDSSPDNNSIDIVRTSYLSITVFDYQGDSMDITFRSNSSGSWVDLGANSSVGNGTYSQRFVNSTSYSTRYWWSVNISGSWTNATYSFTTESNVGPVISSPIPRDGRTRVSTYTANLSVVITDNNFNYTIETFPDVGSISENSVSAGVKTVVVTDLNYSTLYTWFVNATDGNSWTNTSFVFTTKSSTDFDIEGFKLNLPEWAVGPFKVYVGDFVWMMLFIGVIAITWGSSDHISSVFAVILLLFAAYSTQRVFVDNSEISLLFSIIAAVCIAAIMLGLFLRKRQG